MHIILSVVVLCRSGQDVLLLDAPTVLPASPAKPLCNMACCHVEGVSSICSVFVCSSKPRGKLLQDVEICFPLVSASSLYVAYVGFLFMLNLLQVLLSDEIL